MLVPKELKFEHSGGVKAMTTEQIERGIELIKEMLAKREANLIERTAKDVTPKPKRKALDVVSKLANPSAD